MTVSSYTTPNGETRWKYYVFGGYDTLTGRQIKFRKKGFLTKKEAEIHEARTLHTFQENGKSSLIEEKKKFKDVASEWLLQYEGTVKENTYVTSMQLVNNKLLPKFGEIYINRLTFEMCQKAVNEWSSTYCKSTLLISLFNRIITFGIKLNYCTENPMLLVTRPKNTMKEEYDAPFYSKEELEEFLETVKKQESLKYYVMFHLLAYTGLRRAELLGLRWSDISFREEFLKVNQVLARAKQGLTFQTPKTKKSNRKIMLDTVTLQYLMKWKTEQKRLILELGQIHKKDQQLVFTSAQNDNMSLETPNKILSRILKNNDLPHMTIHGFRHTHCSLLFEAGVDMNDVKDRLGHSSITTTMNIYAHVNQKNKKNVVEKLSQFMFGN